MSLQIVRFKNVFFNKIGGRGSPGGNKVQLRPGRGRELTGSLTNVLSWCAWVWLPAGGDKAKDQEKRDAGRI